MHNKDCILQKDTVNDITQLLYKLDINSAKMEQCAFDSINTTDQIMLGMQNIIGMMQQLISQQAELCSAIELCTLTLDQKEGANLIRISGNQAEQLANLEVELHKLIHSTVEANDAAHSIEAGIAEQSESVSQLLQYSENLMQDEL